MGIAIAMSDARIRTDIAVSIISNPSAPWGTRPRALELNAWYFLGVFNTITIITAPTYISASISRFIKRAGTGA
jgi:hypothetical protein